jgi:hypothetical protein
MKPKVVTQVEEGYCFVVGKAVSFCREWEPGARVCRRTTTYEYIDKPIAYGEESPKLPKA